jgi:hypothetical protein
MFARLFEHWRLAVREARFVRVSLLLAAGLVVLNWALNLWFVLPRLATSPFFALHYTVYFGVDQIGPTWRLAMRPLLGTAILLVNGFLALRFHDKERLVSAFLMALTLLLEGLLLANAFLTILLNI